MNPRTMLASTSTHLERAAQGDLWIWNWVYAYWTRSLLLEHEVGVPILAWGWFRYTQLRHYFVHSCIGLAVFPQICFWQNSLVCTLGPWAYFASRRRLRMQGRRLEQGYTDC